MNEHAMMWRLLGAAQPGQKKGGVKSHVQRGAQQLQLINARYPDIKRPEQLRLKHAVWLRDYGLANLGPATRYHHYRTLRVVASALSRWSDWESRLVGTWCNPQGESPDTNASGTNRGGRPPKLPGRR
ncbi:hypothetical protein [Salinisphaera aquimarina]|uniref:Uncharacterized protein n=1 Tax=Salinisphaera aquimarina TaxID=2094031 RepID=A0ABV7EST5_9GAMM